jgi:hypothetical protein
MDRRRFLKLAPISTALAISTEGTSEARPASVASQTSRDKISPSSGGVLPAIPNLQDLASDRLVHHFRDLFNPPLAQNEWGCLQAAKSVSGITAISFPPYACCNIPKMPFSPGSLITCELYLDGRLLNSYPDGARVAYTWYPHRIVRETSIQGLRLTTHTFLPSQQRAVAQWIEVKNESRQNRRITLGFDLRAAVAAKLDDLWFIDSPAEADNRITSIESCGCLLFEAQHSAAVSIQGVSPRPNRVENGRMLVCELSLPPGEMRALRYVNIIGNDKDTALESYERAQSRFEELLKENEEVFTGVIRSAFLPGNSEFSGHLPQLVTRDKALWRLYYTGFISLLFARRVSPDSVYGPAYLTIPPVAPTLSYIWDAMLTSLSLALLDPQVLRSIIEVWMTRDMHQHLATDYLTGKGVGTLYAVNDMGILRCAHAYLRVTGDWIWLDKELEGKPIIEHLADHALYWKKLDRSGHGLADYGNLDNLLEVVSTWIHEVPAINAGNVYGMRFVATLLERRGDSRRAAELRSEARELAARISRLLYVEGSGRWMCGYPDGTFHDVGHCVDLLTLLDMMFDDLSEKQKREMSHFFWSELHTPLWMHALSPRDVDATWNVRADHSWLGAYTAWPSMTAKGLYKIDPSARVAAWVKGLSMAGNQGPFGQAHLVETSFPTENGGALKSPLEQPYGNNWFEISGGSFADLVIDSIFGADLTLYDGLRVNSRLADFDSEAKLLNLNYQGKTYTITEEGSQAAS